MGSGFSKMKKQAKMMQNQFGQVQKQMQDIEAEGTAGNGLVRIVLNGEKAMKSLTIQPECVDPQDVEGLQDLIMAAFAEAAQKVDATCQNLSPLPGFF